ncbi:unnamed protein product [Cylicostephanus goldi]|uniref:Mannosyltransferase n=1 Tax=Cylicostephanus goldi TaxID=71465 RepID=A0A3P6QQ26_CYLGO|nr:unnamed protein product [Cylicostephanus goldi]
MLTIVMRPTAAILWAVFGLSHLLRHPKPLDLIFKTVLPAALPVLALCTLIDSLYYLRPTCALWNFFNFNVLKGGSAHFGVHPWYWYFLEGLPSVLTIQILPIVLGLLSPLRPTLLPLLASAVYVLAHTLLPHKEQRFLLPIIPLLCIYAGPFFAARKASPWRRVLLYTMLAVNAAIALYCGLRHQVGPYHAADSVLTLAAKKGGNASVAALMPCYTIPGHSYFHDGVDKIRMLDCSPSLDTSVPNKEMTADEADKFHKNPRNWVDRHWNEVRWHTYVLMFEKTYLQLADWFRRFHYTVCDRVFHADIPISDRQDRHIVVLCKT